MKKLVLMFVIISFLGLSFDAKAFLAHEPFFDLAVFDIGGAISRALSTLIKAFLGDDKKIVAELVYDGDEGGGPCGGNGGAYTGDNGSAIAPLSAVASTITDIPAEANAYPDDVRVQDTDIAKLADLRIKEIVRERASLDSLSDDKWAILYRAQQRSIQAMTDALVMKKAYKDLAAVAEQASSGSYSNYSEAVSTVATRRLLLDALMALRKRVIAARIRARAETMEMDIGAVSTEPMLEGGQAASAGGSNNQNSTVEANKPNSDQQIEDYGLNGNEGNASSENQQQGENEGE